jgi:hypothetical protein
VTGRPLVDRRHDAERGEQVVQAGDDVAGDE